MQGTLSPESLQAAFRELQARAASGVLFVQDRGSTKRVFFDGGRITAAESSDSGEQIGEQLLRRHKLTPSDLHRARTAAEHSGKPLSVVLDELAILSHAELENEVAVLSRAILEALFELRTGEYRFEERAPDELSPGTLDLAPGDVASHALRRADERLNAVLRWSDDAEPGSHYGESTLSTTHSAVLDLLKERFRPGLTMNDVVEMSSQSREETLDGLEALLAAGILQIGDEESRVDAEPKRPGALFPAGSPPEKLGRFEVQKVLGRGSMGAVLLAKDPAIDRIVAIKLIQTAIHLPPSKQQKYKERFYREASAAGQLIHPNIVTVYDVGHAGDQTPFIVMEYVEGQTLSDLLETQTLSSDQAFQIARDILAGLSFAHAQGIVHRDVKPGNIIVTREFRGKIMDFGIAHVVGSELTTEDDVLGSPYYMAPEQLSKGTIDRRTDLFSFAVVLYRMVTGALPFTGDSFAAIAQSILHDDPVPPDARNGSISSALRSVILRCLEKDPSNRYDRAEDVIAALESARRGAHPPGVSGRTAKPVVAHRDRWLSISVALILGAFLVFGIALTLERGAESITEADVAEPSTSAEVEDTSPPDEASPPDETSASASQTAGAENAEPASRPTAQPEPGPVERAPDPKPAPPAPAPENSEPIAETESRAPSMADLFFEARTALERGDLAESQAWLEELLLKDPTFNGASELYVEVTDRIWEEKLPLLFRARHNHRIGGCDGELSLTTLGVRFVSASHDWAWSHEEIRVLEREGASTVFVETFETDLIGLGKNKRYKFELEVTLSNDDWTRYQRSSR